MNLVCFPHYTAGGLLCEVLNSTVSGIGFNGGFSNSFHSLGKIGDSDTIFDLYDPGDLYEKLRYSGAHDTTWAGTHCWPGLLDLTRFHQVINVTTATYRSKLFRWARAYVHYFQNTGEVKGLLDLEKKDKMRLLAKNYIKPFLPVTGSNVLNLEFSSIVDFDTQANSIIGDNPRYKFWKDNNTFLYDPDFWQSDIVERFHEAEFEVVTGTDYVYK